MRIKAVKLPMLMAGLVLAACASGQPAVRVSQTEGVAAPEPAPSAPVAEVQVPALMPELEAPDLAAPTAEMHDAEPEPPEVVLASSLEAYESAEEFWQGGAFEDAFAALDRAYELMSSVTVNGDAGLAQEKEDLRRLISRRVVEIYASRRNVVGRIEDSIPLTVNRHVEAEIKRFQTTERESFLAAYARSGRYRPFIVEELAKRGLPEQLSWLPVVESWFKVKAFSRARALGMWQFIASTGYRFGLQRNDWYDQRIDPERATLAAIAYLTELHELFGDWTTALAAYNCGEARVLRLIRAQRISYFDNFWDLYELLPGETRRFVPRFLATLAIIEDPARYGFDDLPAKLPRLAYDTLDISRPLRLTDLERAMGLESGALAELNPELRQGATPDGEYQLKVPPGTAGAASATLAALPAYRPPEVQTSIHRVRPGETLSTIARRYGSSVSTLMRLNSLRNPNRIWPGQRLRVTGRASSGPHTPLAAGERISYTVQRGDSLWRIADRFGTTVDRIRSDNRLSSSVLQPGQALTIAGSGAGGSGQSYVVRQGDTLSSIAGRSRVSVRQLAEVNGLSLRSTIYPGQRLRIP